MSMKLDTILRDAQDFYGDLNNPKYVNLAEVDERSDRARQAAFLTSLGLSFTENTDLNSDRAHIYELDEPEGSIVLFSFVEPYISASESIGELIKASAEQYGYQFVDTVTLQNSVSADPEYFSFEDEVKLYNVLFSDDVLDFA